MGHLAFIDILGYWLGIALTLCILSFLYKDNPIYKFAEHLFIGVSIGYVVMKQYYDTLRPKLIDNLFDKPWFDRAGADGVHPAFYLAGVLLVVMLLAKAASQRWAWLGRFPIAFVVAFYAGLQINGVAQGDLGPQMTAAMQSVVAEKVDLNRAPAADLNLLPGMVPSVTSTVLETRELVPLQSLDDLAKLDGLSPAQVADLEQARGHLTGLDAQATVGQPGTYWFGTFSRLLMLLGLLASLVYFYFSVEHVGVVGRVSRFGVWVLMLGFGAAFGFTVQGRLSLAIGRALDVLGRDKDPVVAAQIHGGAVALVSLLAIVAGIAVWEIRRRKAGSVSTEP